MCKQAASQGLASEILARDDASLHTTVRKIKKVCRDELEAMVESGTIDPEGTLFAGLSTAAYQMNLTSVLCESINSQIKGIAQTARNISLELLSSKISSKKQVAFEREATFPAAATPKQHPSWKEIKPHAERVLGHCVLYADSASSVIMNADRFAQASAEANGLEEEDVKKYLPSKGNAKVLDASVRPYASLTKEAKRHLALPQQQFRHTKLL